MDPQVWTFWICFWCVVDLITNRHQSVLLPEIVELESTLGLLEGHSELAILDWILIYSVFSVLFQMMQKKKKKEK